MVQFNHDDVMRTLHLLHSYPDALVELRILTESNGTHSGYFKDFDRLAKAAERWNSRGNIYVTLNRINPDCAARRLNRTAWTKSGETTKDSEIIRRANIYIDCDPVRITGIASTDAEHAASMDVAVAIKSFLTELGLPETALISSGNGHGLFLSVDLPAEDGGLVKKFLGALATKFDNERVKVDPSVCNAGRIARLPGTLNCKGENLAERPHRLAKSIEPPAALTSATIEQLQSVIESILGKKAESKVSASDDRFDLVAWLNSRQVSYTISQKAEGTQYSLNECPFKSADHAAGGCSIFQRHDGSIVASCFHAKCKAVGWGWPELREKLDPSFDARAEEAALSGTESVRDPHRLARIVLREYEHPEHRTIVLLNGLYYTWRDGVWTEQTIDDIRLIITRCVKAEFDRYSSARARNGAPCETPQVTITLVSNVLNALGSLIEVNSIDGPGWLKGGEWPIREILVCKSSIVHWMDFSAMMPRLVCLTRLDCL
jgi:hypothetical protein